MQAVERVIHLRRYERQAFIERINNEDAHAIVEPMAMDQYSLFQKPKIK